MDNKTITHSVLTARQINSLHALQRKVEITNKPTCTVSPAQFKAMQTAYNALKAAGQVIPAEAVAHAKKLGLE